MALLQDLLAESRRLAIVGRVVGDDFRLRALREPLAGSASPAMKRLLASVDAVLDAGTEAFGAQVLLLITLLSAMVRTQADLARFEGAVRITPLLDAMPTAPMRYRELESLRSLAANAGSGERVATMHALSRSAAMDDLRAVSILDSLLSDRWGELADWAMQQLMRQSPRIAPLLRSRLDYFGKSAQARRLKVYVRLVGLEARDTLLEVLDRGSLEMRVAALECMPDFPDIEEIVKPHLHAKAQSVRIAALQALAQTDSPEYIETVVEYWLSDNKSADDYTDVLAKLRKPNATRRILEVAEELNEHLPERNKALPKPKEKYESYEKYEARWRALCTILQDRPEAIGFLIDCLKHKKGPQAPKSALDGQYAYALYNSFTREGLEALDDMLEELHDPWLLIYTIPAVLLTRSPEDSRIRLEKLLQKGQRDYTTRRYIRRAWEELATLEPREIERIEANGLRVPTPDRDWEAYLSDETYPGIEKKK